MSTKDQTWWKPRLAVLGVADAAAEAQVSQEYVPRILPGVRPPDPPRRARAWRAGWQQLGYRSRQTVADPHHVAKEVVAEARIFKP
jgi:hypothetical protein